MTSRTAPTATTAASCCWIVRCADIARSREPTTTAATTIPASRGNGWDIITNAKLINEELRRVEQILSINKRINIDEEVVNVSKANAHQDVPVRIAKEDWKWCVRDEKGIVSKEAGCDSERHGRKLMHQLCRNVLETVDQNGLVLPFRAK